MDLYHFSATSIVYEKKWNVFSFNIHEESTLKEKYFARNFQFVEIKKVKSFFPHNEPYNQTENEDFPLDS